MPQQAAPPPPAGYRVVPPPPSGYNVVAPPIDPNLPHAIGQAEGAHPDDHNPGNLSVDAANKLGIPVSGSRRSTGVGATDIAQFPDDETGAAALRKHLSKYPPTTSYQDLANQYAPGQPDWLNNVTKIMGAKPTDPIGGPQYLPRPKPSGLPAPGVGQHDSTLWAQTKEYASQATDLALGAAQRTIAPYADVAQSTAASVNAGLKNAVKPSFSPEELQRGGQLMSYLGGDREAADTALQYAGAVARRIGGVGSSIMGGLSAPFTIPTAPLAKQTATVMRPAEELPAGLAGGFQVGPDGRYTVGNPDVDKTLQTIGGVVPFALLGGMHESASEAPTERALAADKKATVDEPRSSGPREALPQAAPVVPDTQGPKATNIETKPEIYRRPEGLTGDASRGANRVGDVTPLHPQLHSDLEQMAGQPLTPEEANNFLRYQSEQRMSPAATDASSAIREERRSQLEQPDPNRYAAKPEPPAGYNEVAAPQPKITTDSNGTKWAENEAGVRVSIPNRIPTSEIPEYANQKLAEQADMQAAVKQKAAAVPETTTPKEAAPLSQQMAELEKSAARLRRPDLLPNQRSFIAEGHDAALSTAAKTIAESSNPDLAQNLFATRSGELAKQIDYLQRHLKDRDKILETERAAADVTRTGQDIARNKATAGVPLHPERDAYGNMLVNDEGDPVSSPGAPRAMRDALGNLLGKRGAEVVDKQATPEGPVPEHIQRAMDERDELKEAISSGAIGPENFGDASDSLKTLEGIISEYRRTATKQSFKPTKAQVAEAKGVPVSEVESTGAGKAADINHNGLPVITRKIWEDVYGGGKGKPLPTADQIASKVTRLQAQKEIIDTVSSRASDLRAIAEKKKTQGGYLGQGSEQDDVRKLLSNVDQKYYTSLTPETPAPYQGWLTPDRSHFVPTGGLDNLDTQHNGAARKLLGNYFDPLAGSAERQLLNKGWIRKAEEGTYEIGHATPRHIDTIEKDVIASGYTNEPTIIDYIDRNNQHVSIGVEGGSWLDKGLLRAVNGEAMRLGLPRIAGDEGASGVRVATGMAAGGLVGGAVGGPIGAGVGAALGGIASAIDLPKTVANLGTELTELRAKFGYSIEQARDSYRDWLSPVSKDPAVADVMFNRNAEIARSDAHAREAFSAYRLGGYSLPRDLQVKFVDLVKAGDHTGIEQQFGPEWRQYAEDRLIKENDNWIRMNQANADLSAAKGGGQPNMLPWIENHDRVMWKTIPGGKDWIAHNLSRQLEGTKGMLKQHTLADMSTGVAAGGVPYSWNPVENDLLAWHDTERFIQTTKAVAQFIDQHKADPNIPGAEFVKLGDRAPDGYVKTSGTRSEVYFPAQSGEGLIKAGEWYMHKDIARMIDNVTSPDYIRNNVIGRTWLGWRRTIGTGRLFGPFHAFLMNTTAMGYGAGMGIREAANLGIGNADIGHIMSGLRDLATSPVSGVKEFKIGQAAREGEFDQSFWQKPEGQKLKQLYPGVENYLDLLWQGGGKNMFRVEEDMRLRYSEGLKQHAIEAADKFSKGKYLQSGYEASATAGNALLLPIQLAMKPLFETYIPSLKLGHALNDLDLSLQERAADIASGKTTEATVARDVVRRVEGYFGEFNADNLFLKNTFRTALTAYYRSFSFRFGTIDRAWAAVKGQATNVAEAARGQARLQLNPDVAVWGGLLMHAAIGSAILMKTMAHKNPTSLTDVMHPQMGELDDRGKPIRADWPSYISGPASQMKQNYGLGTLQYATGGQSDFLQFMKEAINNKKFDGGYVADPAEHGKMGELFWRFSHAVVPIGPGGKYPFVIENTQRWATSGMPKGKAAAAVALGMSPTRRAEGLTDAEGLALELGSSSSHTPIYSDTEQKRYQATRELTAALRNKRSDAGQMAGQMLRDNQIAPSDLAKAFTNSNIPYLKYEVEGDKYKKGLDFKDTYAVMKQATPEEKKQLVPYFIKLYSQTVAKDPKNQSAYTSQLLEVMPRTTMPNVGQPSGKIPTKFHANLPIGETMGDPDTRFTVAQHEAAHAVVAENLQPGSVQNIAFNKKGATTNVAAPDGMTDMRQLSPDQITDRIAISLAGGLAEPGGTTTTHASGDRRNRQALLGGLASTPTQDISRLLTGGVFGKDTMLQAPEIQAAAQARANLTLADPRMRSAIQGLAGQLNQTGQMSGEQVRGYLKNGR